MNDKQKEPIDWLTPIATPKQVSAFFGLTLRNMNHLLHCTIGDAARPARGRGIPAGFSYRDIALMMTGRDILAFGLTPPKVRRCIDTIVHEWRKVQEVMPVPLFLSEHEIYASEYNTGSRAVFLLADMDGSEFQVSLEDGSEIGLDAFNWRPHLGFNITYCVLEALRQWDAFMRRNR